MESLPLWECGLKSPRQWDYSTDLGHSPCGSVDWNAFTSAKIAFLFSSLPLWECGLKLLMLLHIRCWHSHSPCGSVDWNCSESRKIKHFIVTPLVGVWIEIVTGIHPVSSCFGHSPCGSVDWNTKRCLWMWRPWCHSPCGSVDWNSQWTDRLFDTLLSLPLRECGLKYRLHNPELARQFVTPLAGVWIEIYYLYVCTCTRYCHSPCGSVDWNSSMRALPPARATSLPLRECGLKYPIPCHIRQWFPSLPLRECGLK